MQHTDLLINLAASFALLVTYLLVGQVFWTMIKARLGNDVHASVMLEQELQGQMAMLLPKFTVILLWPLALFVAVAFFVATFFRQTVPATH